MTKTSEIHARGQIEFPGPASKLDPVRDMEPIRMGDLNYGHRGLAIQASIKDQGTMYGRITQIEHGDQFSKVKVRWRGSTTSGQQTLTK